MYSNSDDPSLVQSALCIASALQNHHSLNAVAICSKRGVAWINFCQEVSANILLKSAKYSRIANQFRATTIPISMFQPYRALTFRLRSVREWFSNTLKLCKQSRRFVVWGGIFDRTEMSARYVARYHIATNCAPHRRFRAPDQLSAGVCDGPLQSALHLLHEGAADVFAAKRGFGS